MSYIYPRFKDRLARREAHWENDSFYAVMMPTGTVFTATDETLDDVGQAPGGYSEEIGGKSVDMGTFYADNMDFAGVGGPEVSVVLIIQGAPNLQALLVAYLDDVRGLPFTPTGVSCELLWGGAGGAVFTL